MIKVYSHPRSGTHLLEAFLGENFYSKKNLNIPNVTWGHWSNRKVNPEGNKYGKLFGNHYLPEQNKNETAPMIYIFRDVRAVAFSIWRTENFINPNIKGISFSDFIRTNIDWEMTPGKQTIPKQNIIKHWYHHVDIWHQFTHHNVLIIQYEDLIVNPEKVYTSIQNKYFPLLMIKALFVKNKIKIISNPIGLLPNEAKISSWKQIFTDQDNNFVLDQLPINCSYLYND